MPEGSARPEGDVHKKPFTIIVNGQPKEWDKNRISFDEVVKLAYPTPPPGQIDYTVTYTKGPPHHREGTLLKGQSVEVVNGMVFDVVPTVKS